MQQQQQQYNNTNHSGCQKDNTHPVAEAARGCFFICKETILQNLVLARRGDLGAIRWLEEARLQPETEVQHPLEAMDVEESAMIVETSGSYIKQEHDAPSRGKRSHDEADTNVQWANGAVDAGNDEIQRIVDANADAQSVEESTKRPKAEMSFEVMVAFQESEEIEGLSASSLTGSLDTSSSSSSTDHDLRCFKELNQRVLKQTGSSVVLDQEVPVEEVILAPSAPPSTDPPVVVAALTSAEGTKFNPGDVVDAEMYNDSNDYWQTFHPAKVLSFSAKKGKYHCKLLAFDGAESTDYFREDQLYCPRPSEPWHQYAVGERVHFRWVQRTVNRKCEDGKCAKVGVWVKGIVVSNKGNFFNVEHFDWAAEGGGKTVRTVKRADLQSSA